MDKQELPKEWMPLTKVPNSIPIGQEAIFPTWKDGFRAGRQSQRDDDILAVQKNCVMRQEFEALKDFYVKQLEEATNRFKNLPKIVCLCGSTRYPEAFRQAMFDETMKGNIVVTIGCNMRTDADLFAGYEEENLTIIKEQLDELHLRKIDLADEVFILNVGGYIGKSTQNELDYAEANNKVIRFLEPPIEKELR